MQNSKTNKTWLLFRTLLYSPGGFNEIRHETDKKKKGRLIGGQVGMLILYGLIAFLAVWISVISCLTGLGASAPRLAAMIVSALGFISGFLRTNGYLFGAKDYEMLMALPFSEKTVVSAKFLCMYFRNITLSVVLSFSVMIGYAIVMRPGFLSILIWIVLTFVLPMIPMVIGACIGAVAAAIGSRSRHRGIVQTIVIFALGIACIGFRFFANRLFAPQYRENTMAAISGFMDKTEVYFPIKWFTDAVMNHGILSFLLLLLISLLLYEGAFFLIGKRYRAINSRLIGHARRKKYKMGTLKAGKVVNAIAKKELKRFIGSSTYLTNIGLGQLLGLILAVAILIVGPDKILGLFMPGVQNAGDHTVVWAVIPVFIFFFVGMASAAACSYSIEGSSVWIIRSLPIRIKDILRGKMRFNLWITLPFMWLAAILCAIAFKMDVWAIVAFLIEGTALCFYSTAFGMFLGIQFGNTQWTQEADVIKRGAAQTIYIFANIGIEIVLMILSIVLGIIGAPWIPMVIVTAIAAGLAVLFFWLLRGAAKKHLW